MDEFEEVLEFLDVLDTLNVVKNEDNTDENHLMQCEPSQWNHPIEGLKEIKEDING